MPDPPLMLGVSGLRGIAGRSLTPEVAARFAGTLGAILRERAAPRRPGVLLCRDGRAGGEVFEHAAVAGLAAAGVDVTIGGIAMTPSVAVALDVRGFDAAIIITASHNPQEWNGLKAIVRDRGAGAMQPNAAAPSVGDAEALIARFRSGEPPWVDGWDGAGRIEQMPPGQAGDLHAARVCDALARRGLVREKRFRVALDCGGGSGAISTPGFLSRTLGCAVEVSGLYAGGRFTRAPEPTAANLASFGPVVRAQGAAVGFAQDPDADRLAIFDERGTYIGEEYTPVVAAMAVLGGEEEAERRRDGESKGPDGAGERVIVVNLSTSRMIDDVAARYGARVVRTPVGEANVAHAMKALRERGCDVVLGGEGNGGVIWPAVSFVRDSLSAMALTLTLMARTGKALSELVAEIPAYAIEKRKVELLDRHAANLAIEAVRRCFEEGEGTGREPAAAGRTGHREPRASNARALDQPSPTPPEGRGRVDLCDGVRVDFDGRRAWIHVRASNTEPILRLIAEAPDPAAARSLLDEAAGAIAAQERRAPRP